jgi:DNA-binding winged helix-turn-helix (wHTH) protein
MGMPVNTPRAWRFGVFELDASSGELRRNGTVVRLREQPARILLLLLENAGQIVTREQLRQQLWPSDTFVDFRSQPQYGGHETPGSSGRFGR